MSYMVGQKQARRPQAPRPTPRVDFGLPPGPEDLPHRAPREEQRERPQRVERSHVVDLIGQELIIQAKGGPRIEGTLTGYRGGFLIIEPARIVGREYTCDAETAWVDRGNIGFMHRPGTVTPRMEGE